VTSLLLQEHEPNGGKRDNPDLWTAEQFEAVAELAADLSILGQVDAINLSTSRQWTALIGTAFAVAFLDGEDGRRTWTEIEHDYRKRFESEYVRPEARRNPVLLAAIRSAGLVQPLVKACQFDITKPMATSSMSMESSITRASEPRFYVCQDTLFAGARQAPKIGEYLLAEMRQILE
jgi:hypothetical protein